MATSAEATDNGSDGQEKPFRLLDLPPELWIKIGQMAVDDATEPNKCLAREKESAEDVSGAWPLDSETTVGESQRVLQPAITKTCRILRRELLPYHYENNVTLVLIECLQYWEREKINKWLAAIGTESRKKIRCAYLMIRQGSKHRLCVEDTGEVREFFFGNQMAVEIGPPVAIPETPKDFQDYYYYHLGGPCCGQEWARKIKFI
ncbi:hypothetical protein HII31_09913 [Pseudocercospora fuligena]|uniref:F-box domain-containing protein n=1 Tax=Pseudocercospora fuligena TaxID=685502 RepID=A0A8H6REN7_9PEZI|nr:hypothetical protein HII31_09913 [Pseudocercospora fuligena]